MESEHRILNHDQRTARRDPTNVPLEMPRLLERTKLRAPLFSDLERVPEKSGGTRAIVEMHHARRTDAEQNRSHFADPISCPVLAVGAQAYLDFFAGG